MNLFLKGEGALSKDYYAADVPFIRESSENTVGRLLSAAAAANTKRAYSSRLRTFAAWCSGAKLSFSPAAPLTVALFIGYLVNSGKSCSTIQQSLAAISLYLSASGYEDSTKNELVKRAVKGARRTIGVAPAKKHPMRVPVLEAIINAIDRSAITGLRDAALLLTGFAGAFRRSELAGLDAGDIYPTTAGDGRPAYEIYLRRSKTDQEGRGQIKGLFSAVNSVLCPVSALREYIAGCGISEGPLFRQIRKGGRSTELRLSDKSVALIVKSRAKNAGVELDLSGHSLRSGFITAAAEAGKTERSIQNQTGHRSVATLRGYIQRIDALQDNAAAGLL